MFEAVTRQGEVAVKRSFLMKRTIALTLVASLSGCYSRVIIPTNELTQLDGFGADDTKTPGKRFELHGTEGERVAFGADTPLTLVTDAPRGPFHFWRISVDGKTFEGLSTGRSPLRLDLDAISQVQTQVLNGDRTVLAVLGAVLATALAGASIGALVIVSRIQR